jgi:hypothetical protein
MKSSFVFTFIFLLAGLAQAQKGSFSVKVDKDTMFTDEVLKVEFLIDNLTGNFKAPDFSGFRLVAGPNTSSSMSIINGEISQKKSYSYVLMPDETGLLYIGSASLKTENDNIETEPIDIVVLDVYDNNRKINRKQKTFRRDIDTNSSEPNTEKSKTKRVLKKI